MAKTLAELNKLENIIKGLGEDALVSSAIKKLLNYKILEKLVWKLRNHARVMKNFLFFKKILFIFIVCVVMMSCYTDDSCAAIISYTDFTSFNIISGHLMTTDFDTFVPGTTFTQPAIFDNV